MLYVVLSICKYSVSLCSVLCLSFQVKGFVVFTGTQVSSCFGSSLYLISSMSRKREPPSPRVTKKHVASTQKVPLVYLFFVRFRFGIFLNDPGKQISNRSDLRVVSLCKFITLCRFYLVEQINFTQRLKGHCTKFSCAGRQESRQQCELHMLDCECVSVIHLSIRCKVS